MKRNIWIFSLEPLDTRYTGQWLTHVPELLAKALPDCNVRQINGIQKNSSVTQGAFLNFSDTNYWKSSQLCAFLDHFNAGETTPNDYFLFTDAWNPTCIQVKYMSELLGLKWQIGGLWHAGSYDSQDFLGRLVGDKPWVRHAEKSFFNCYDHNYFATEFHIDMFLDKLLGLTRDIGRMHYLPTNKIIRTGWPMEYMPETLQPYMSEKKEDIILFPHRIAPEKQVDIFKDLEKHLPQYKFIVCQERHLTKHEYHTLLGKAKMVFSANLQETLGISTCVEGPLVRAIPFAPNRLSYSEMLSPEFLYPSEWTTSFDAYTKHKTELIERITKLMSCYDILAPKVQHQCVSIMDKFFNAHVLIDTVKTP